ncbi:V-type proton ATPase subunit F, putative [Plasmodium ovale curtisi]|uniref:V-type proton ATPase subunit F, putative n=1 Tax=Plasmodium ovale curtisi TaxID=864141 RepID=A0A1A8WGA2_PLAOA|nr:V-type proton ATPase subunit F, putative [Plasmodium ovale curtisi]
MTSRRHKFFNETDLKIYIIGDEDSVVGFLLAGIGFRDGLGKKNFFIVNSSKEKYNTLNKKKEDETYVHCRTVGLLHPDKNYTRGQTNKAEIEEVFKEYTSKSDCGVILMNQQVIEKTRHVRQRHQKFKGSRCSIADEIRYLVDLHDKILPTVLEIPSKDKPFDPNKDSIIQRVKLFFGGDISNIK